MDIEIEADGRRVRVSEVECEFIEDCTKIAVDVWRKVKPRAKPVDPKNRIGFIVESQP
jgi:hypothetical protein